MELYLDLNKSMLNFAKLVKKQVQVRGKNGKVFTRMQWVSPGEASSGMGVRMVNTKKGWEDAKKDGIHHHPDYHAALKDQGVHEDTFEDHHPHFFLPETEDSYNNRNDRLEEIEKKHGFGAVVDAGEHEYTYDHEFEPPDHVHKVYNEFHFVPREPKPTDVDEEKFLQEHGIHPEVHAVAKSIESLDLDNHKYDYTKIEEMMRDIALNHWHTLKSHIEDKIRTDLPDDNDPDTKFIRNVQLNALKNGDMNHALNMAQHPIVARAAVNKILGKHTADKWRDHIKDASLSVNFPGMHKEAIQRDGYKSSQLTDYIKKHIGEHGLDKLEEAIANHDNFHDQIQALDSLPEMSWSDVIQRATAEHDAIGLELEDRKPTYVALNPTNRDTGAASFYGNRWLKVNGDILKHCTATLDDSFNTSKSFAKVWSMDHLKDIFILKQLERGQGEGNSDSEWATDWGDIPIELQYHKPELTPDQFELMADPGEAYRNGTASKKPKSHWNSYLTGAGSMQSLMTEAGLNHTQKDDFMRDWYADGYSLGDYLKANHSHVLSEEPDNAVDNVPDYDDLFGGDDTDDEDDLSDFYSDDNDDEDYDDLDLDDDNEDFDFDDLDDLDLDDDDDLVFENSPKEDEEVTNGNHIVDETRNVGHLHNPDSEIGDGSYSSKKHGGIQKIIADYYGWDNNLKGLKHDGNNKWSFGEGGTVTITPPDKDYNKADMKIHNPKTGFSDSSSISEALINSTSKKVGKILP
jgi:hypothetical protein